MRVSAARHAQTARSDHRFLQPRVSSFAAPADPVSSPTPNYVTVQRVIKRTNADGTVDLVTRRVRLRPERVLPNGDVVVRRTIRRKGPDGVLEDVVEDQVIRRRRTEKAVRFCEAGSDAESMPELRGGAAGNEATRAISMPSWRVGESDGGARRGRRSGKIRRTKSSLWSRGLGRRLNGGRRGEGRKRNKV